MAFVVTPLVTSTSDYTATHVNPGVNLTSGDLVFVAVDMLNTASFTAAPTSPNLTFNTVYENFGCCVYYAVVNSNLTNETITLNKSVTTKTVCSVFSVSGADTGSPIARTITGNNFGNGVGGEETVSAAPMNDPANLLLCCVGIEDGTFVDPPAPSVKIHTEAPEYGESITTSYLLNNGTDVKYVVGNGTYNTSYYVIIEITSSGGGGGGGGGTLYSGIYDDVIDALSPDHRWTFSAGDLTDKIGSLTVTATGTGTGSGLCRDVTDSVTTTAIANSRLTIPTDATINNSVQSRKAITGWFMVSKINAHPVRIYGEGNNTTTFQLVMAFGNTVMLEVVDASVIQCYGIPLLPNRKYHLYAEYRDNSQGDSLSLYIDGVLVSSNPVGDAGLSARGTVEIGDPVGTVGVGGDTVLLQAPVIGAFNQWATWSDKTLPTPTQIREDLFEKGAVATDTISTQAELDALANTIRSNETLGILVNVAGDISLSADNIVFDEKTSIHVQYAGTGTLTWTNLNGSNASIGSVLQSSGVISFVNPATLTIEGIIPGAEVRLYDDETPGDFSFNTELAGIESNPGTTFVYNHGGSNNTIVVQMMATGYVEIIQQFTLGPTNQTLTLYPKVDTNI